MQQSSAWAWWGKGVVQSLSGSSKVRAYGLNCRDVVLATADVIR